MSADRADKEVTITAPAIAEDIRLSWQQLLNEAVNKPGTIHEAYTRFWNYSFGNQILALIQCRGRGLEPGPLASFRRWKELGRHVKRGEKALTLCMPLQIKAKDWDQKRSENGLLTDGHENGFRTIFVYKRNWFVLAQTDGEPYQPMPIPGWDKATALASLNIREENFMMLDGNAQGYATGVATVAVSPVAAMPAKTLFHEIAHVILGHHGDGGLQSLHEVEAECVALICCEVLSLPGPEFSRSYVQHWLRGDSIPEKSAQRIFQGADRILKAGTASATKQAPEEG